MKKRDYSKNTFLVFASYYGNHKGLFAFDICMTLLSSAAAVIFPYVTRYSLNNILPNGYYRTFFLIMAGLFLAYILRSVAVYFVTRLGHGLGVLIEADMREEIFSHIQTLSFSFFDKHRTGHIMSHITNDLNDITELAHHGPENVMEAVFTVCGATVVLMRIRWELALVLFLLVPMFVLFTVFMRRRLRMASRGVKEQMAEINTAVETGVSGIRTVKAFGNEELSGKNFRTANDRFRTAKNKYYHAFGLMNSGTEFGLSVMQVIVVAMGGYYIMRGKMTVVDMITFSLYVTTFTTPMRKLSQFYELFEQGFAGFSRFLEIMRTEPDIKDAPDAFELKNVKGDIAYNRVSFRYETGEEVLHDVDLSIQSGETLALVGPSGSGKTTLSQLLPRFYDVTGGSVTVDGQDVRSLTQSSLRRYVGTIQQDVFIFASTIRENIRYGRPDATDEEVIEAAKRAAIHEEILKMPDGYDTFVGERGVMLSGGQRQRISIARVFLKNPPILILDEATSALDSVTEQAIQRSLESLSAGRTVLVIAHRLSTVKNANHIAVIDGAGVAEYGTHEELLAKNGMYAALWHSQQL